MTDEEILKAKRNWLNRAFSAEKEIRRIKREKAHDEELLMTDCTSCTVSYENTGASKGSIGNSTENKIIRYIDKSEEYTQELRTAIEEYMQLKEEIKTAINTLENPIECAILKCRYINFEEVKEIAHLQSYSERHVKRILHNGTLHISCHLMSLDNVKIV